MGADDRRRLPSRDPAGVRWVERQDPAASPRPLRDDRLAAPERQPMKRARTLSWGTVPTHAVIVPGGKRRSSKRRATVAIAQTQRCVSAQPRQLRDDRIPGERSSRRAPSRRCLWRPSATPRRLGASRRLATRRSRYEQRTRLRRQRGGDRAASASGGSSSRRRSRAAPSTSRSDGSVFVGAAVMWRACRKRDGDS